MNIKQDETNSPLSILYSQTKIRYIKLGSLINKVCYIMLQFINTCNNYSGNTFLNMNTTTWNKINVNTFLNTGKYFD